MDCPFSTNELGALRKFRKICDEVTSCRFVKNLQIQDHSFTSENLPDGSVRNRYPNYDKDDFLAFLTHYRKLVADKEPTNIFKVLKIIARYATDEERASLKEIRRMLVAEAKHPPSQIAIGLPGNETAYTPEQIENVVFNAQVFHSNDDLQNDLQKLLDFEPFTKMVFLRYATIVVNQAWQISCVLQKRGYV
jgi:hypothetical protein